MINAPPEKEFIFNDGSRTKNLAELHSRIEKLSDQQFSEFVNGQKNDFANWIEYVLMDKALSDRLRAVISKSGTLYSIKDRMSELDVQDSLAKLSKKSAIPEKTKDHHETLAANMTSKPGQQLVRQEDMSKEERKIWETIFNLFKKKEPEGSESNAALRSPMKESLEHAVHHEPMLKHEMHAHAHEPEAAQKDNILWTVIYVVLILLILGLLVYKLFLQ